MVTRVASPRGVSTELTERVFTFVQRKGGRTAPELVKATGISAYAVGQALRRLTDERRVGCHASTAGHLTTLLNVETFRFERAVFKYKVKRWHALLPDGRFPPTESDA